MPIRDALYWSKVSITSKFPRWRREISHAWVKFEDEALEVSTCDWSSTADTHYSILLTRAKVISTSARGMVFEAFAWESKSLGSKRVKLTPVQVTCSGPRTREINAWWDGPPVYPPPATSRPQARGN